jgi:hypothetical protein
MFSVRYEQTCRVQGVLNKRRTMENVQNCDSGADNLTAIYEPIVYTMWDRQHLTTL